jgi:hypothetical protein
MLPHSFPWRWMQQVSPKQYYRLHGATSHKTSVYTFASTTILRHWDPKLWI